jgi:mono/diheme cytochrome c family protein
MKNIIRITLGTIACVAVIISCKTTTKPVATTTPPAPPVVAATTYKNSIKNIIDDNCAGCHRSGSPKGDFTNYAGVREKIDNGSFKELVIEKKTMPPREPLSSADFNKVKQWLESGAPE